MQGIFHLKHQKYRLAPMFFGQRISTSKNPLTLSLKTSGTIFFNHIEVGAQLKSNTNIIDLIEFQEQITPKLWEV